MEKATTLLYASAYQNFGIDESIIEDFPGSGSGSRNTNATGILAAMRLYIAAFAGGQLDATTGPASYDLTDITRQVLCNLFQDLYGVWANRRGQPGATVAQLRPIADALLGIIADIDNTNAGDKNFLLGAWLADAAAWGFNASQVANRLFNARNQISTFFREISPARKKRPKNAYPPPLPPSLSPPSPPTHPPYTALWGVSFDACAPTTTPPPKNLTQTKP